MIIRDRHKPRPKGWFEEWLDITFPEKLITIAWCGMPYIIWMMVEALSVPYKILTSIGVWILLTLLCWWFGNFMSNQDRHWY